jgi:hypothetical protein
VSPGQIAAAIVSVLLAAAAIWKRDRLSGEQQLFTLEPAARDEPYRYEKPWEPPA